MKTLSTLLCLVMSIDIASAEVPTVLLRRDLAVLVAPVLNASAAVALHDNEITQRELEKALEPLLKSKQAEATEALAVLLGFYVGEASAEDISCELVARGQASMAFLKRYEKVTVVVSGADMTRARPLKSEYAIIEARITSGAQCSWAE